jgi:hypothetical protein
LRLFNAPESSATCTRRDRANTPLQALTLLNDEVFHEAAQALAVHAEEQCAAAGERAEIAWMARRCLARPPGAHELTVLERLWNDEYRDAAELRPASDRVRELAGGADPRRLAAATAVARALLNVDEFITRE